LQNLIEKIVRTKIYASVYWKEHCFGLSAEALIDKAVELKSVGGMVGEPAKPTHFICLILKMLQIQPDKDIIIEFIRNEDYKYLRLLGKAAAATAVCTSGGNTAAATPVAAAAAEAA
jgi:pre-mRNA-splicing factor 38A